MAAGDGGDQAFRAALDGVTTGLAVPLAPRDVIVDFGAGERLEAHDRVRQSLSHGAVWRFEGYGGKHMVAPPRQQLQTLARGAGILGLGQDPSANRDHGITREHMRVIAQNCVCLFACHAPRVVTRHFTRHRGLIDISGNDPARRDAKPGNQFTTTGTGRSKDQPHCGSRPGFMPGVAGHEVSRSLVHRDRA